MLTASTALPALPSQCKGVVSILMNTYSRHQYITAGCIDVMRGLIEHLADLLLKPSIHRYH